MAKEIQLCVTCLGTAMDSGRAYPRGALTGLGGTSQLFMLAEPLHHVLDPPELLLQLRALQARSLAL